MASAAASFVASQLQEYGELTRLKLWEYLGPDRHPQNLYRLAAEYPRRGGRSLRASLCIAAARCFGASTAESLDSAVALELIHNGFLVHDDIEDESEQRRGLPTLHMLHGVPTAVNVGDALAVLSLRPLLRNCSLLGGRLGLRILEEAECMARESVEGQALELEWRRANVIELLPADYLQMILKKTCWYTTIYPCRVGAIIGTRDGVDLDRFVPFGFFLGAAFQIQDDLLNLIGDPGRYGKELSGDLLEGKRTLMLIHLLDHASRDARRRIRQLLELARPARTDREVAWVLDAMKAHGSLEYAQRVAHALAGAAAHEFATAFANTADSDARRFLEALPSWVIERT
jgi:geranylgeranyl diphosphate synthase, type II